MAGDRTLKRFLRRAWRFLGRIDLAGVLLFVLLFVAAFGSCFPQLSSVEADSQPSAAWEEAARGRYGELTDLLVAWGVFRWFHSPFVLVPLGLLALATLVCTLGRWQGIWRKAFQRPVRFSKDRLKTASQSTTLTLPAKFKASVWEGLVREGLRQRGFSVRAEIDKDVLRLRGDRNRLAPLGTLVTHLAILLLLLSAVLSSVYRWREEITIEPNGTAEVGHRSGMVVGNDGFTIARYPDESPAGYEAQVSVSGEEWGVTRGSIQLGEPLTIRGVALYLQAYQETNSGYRLTLLAAHDPGYGPAIASGFLLLLGLTVSFHFPHCSVQAWIEPERVLTLAGSADRRAYDFGRTFAMLVEELGRAAESDEENGD